VLKEHRRHPGVADDPLPVAEGDWFVVTTIGMTHRGNRLI
jgi:hypothetical protein